MRALPEALQSAIAGCECERVTLGESGAALFAFRAPDCGRLFLKHASGVLAQDLRDEADRLAWLAGRIATAPLLAFEQQDDRAWLLTGEVPGIAASTITGSAVDRAVHVFARALRDFHALPIRNCPFDHRVASQLRRAVERARAGRVEEAAFDPERGGVPAALLLDELTRTRPAHEDLVLAHGDACLPNVMLEGGRFSGFVDCARTGVADRCQDLALAARSIERNWGPERVAPFFAAYGLGEPDADKLAFYRKLDEFF